ncbi:MAG: Arc family DNA-binding protein [Lactovum sp.]
MPEKNSSKSKKKKQIPLRLSQSLSADLMAWAEEEFRSLNGQIEYLLSQAVKQKKGTKKSEKIDKDE